MRAPHGLLTFVETTEFTKRIVALGLEESLRNLQQELLGNPAAGDLEPGTGGLRKIRVRDPGRGKGKRGEERIREADCGTEASVAADCHADQRPGVR